MAREIRVITWCDMCQDENADAIAADDALTVESEAQPRPMATEAGRIVTVDLCSDHAEPLRAIYDLAARHGVTPDENAAKPKRRKSSTTATTPGLSVVPDAHVAQASCPLCGDPMSRRGSTHLKNAHYGIPQSVADAFPLPAGTAGLLCECGGIFTAPQGLAVHQSKAGAGHSERMTERPPDAWYRKKYPEAWREWKGTAKASV